MNKESYQEYQRTAHWEALKAWALALAGRCGCGGTDGLQLHHLSYDRLWHEWPEDVVILCRTCHAVEHLMQLRCRWCDGLVFGSKDAAATAYSISGEQLFDKPTCAACKEQMQ